MPAQPGSEPWTRLKQARDPQNFFNPGKILPAA
jgi:FAD/FMN-containing dehydrogenase